MTPRLVPAHWQTVAKVFEKFGCVRVRERGSHVIYDHPAARRPVPPTSPARLSQMLPLDSRLFAEARHSTVEL
ncbi:TPA: hypothetical protein DCY65_02040 [Candidatus Acetothermia bacterium]|nr:hypothetical protein [Candidatus Acetothermia bacterium]